MSEHPEPTHAIVIVELTFAEEKLTDESQAFLSAVKKATTSHGKERVGSAFSFELKTELALFADIIRSADSHGLLCRTLFTSATNWIESKSRSRRGESGVI
jgi:hypothetical protein